MAGFSTEFIKATGEIRVGGTSKYYIRNVIFLWTVIVSRKEGYPIQTLPSNTSGVNNFFFFFHRNVQTFCSLCSDKEKRNRGSSDTTDEILFDF